MTIIMQSTQPTEAPTARRSSTAVPSDATLAERAAGGDETALEGIMRRHNRLLFRTARSILKSDAEAEDALQEAYLRVWRAIATFRSDSKLSTWLVRIVINESLSRLRRIGARVHTVEADDAIDGQGDGSMADDPSDRPECAAMRSELRRLIEARIDLLPEAFRTVFVLRAVEEMSAEEVATVLDLPEATVRTRLFRARRLLREGLSRDVDLATGDAFAFAGNRCDRIVAGVLAKLSDDRDASGHDFS